jgi:hypothetical protein
MYVYFTREGGFVKVSVRALGAESTKVGQKSLNPEPTIP